MRTGRAAEDVGPYHPAPARDVPAPPSARDVRTPPPTSAPMLVGARVPRARPAPRPARLSDITRTGRAAEDVGPYHPTPPRRGRRSRRSATA